jgi:hypothetical protein
MESLAPHTTTDGLRDRISHLLRGSLGAFPDTGLFDDSSVGLSPVSAGLVAGLTYFFLFCFLPWICGARNHILLLLSAWGSAYFAFAVVIAKSTSASALRILAGNILPELSEKAAARIDRDIARRFQEWRLSLVSFVSALIATLASLYAIHSDFLHQPKLPLAIPIDFAFWAVGFFILYLTAARSTDVARFYGTFASNLEADADRLYALDPARSALVTQIAAVGRQMLLFWFGISCSVMTLFMFWEIYKLQWFVLLVVPTASFFSLGFGAVVFVGSERNLRYVTDKIAASTLRETEVEIASLFSRRSELDDLGWTRLKEVMLLHQRLATTGWYRSASFSTLSILSAFAGPVVSILVAIEWHSS